ncbi:hypothetical protein HYY75_05230, partial [bacterium]|nr:hypothetical protein [bacterium]
EKKGEYKKAIEYYLKVENQNDKVVFRIATCYKCLKDFETAIQWFLKMPRYDQNLLEVVDCYKLDSRIKEAIYWLFIILEPLEGNSAELTALKLIEEYTYPGKKTDYPNFNQRLSDIYIAKAVLNYQKDFSQARSDYGKAISLLANGADPKGVSLGVLSRYQNNYKGAMDILEQQREAAERYFENLLREAQDCYNRAEDRYRRAQREAENEYSRRLEQTRRDLYLAECELERLQKEASPSAQLIEQARHNVECKRNDYHNIVNNHNMIVEDYVRPYRREMEEAMQKYRDISNSRTKIIENYIGQYKRKVEEAKRAFELIRNLHESVYGLR